MNDETSFYVVGLDGGFIPFIPIEIFSDLRC